MSRLKNILVVFGVVFTCFWATPGLSAPQIPFELPPKQELKRLRSAVISTSRGEFLVELFPSVAPWHVANFKYLADKGFYRGLRFHIYQEGYIIQGGDPTGTGNGGPGYSLPPEFSEIPHTKGILGMSRRSNDINPERLSNGSQFHIILGDAPHMNKKYTVFGRVIDGMGVVEDLRQGDLIKGITVYIQK